MSFSPTPEQEKVIRFPLRPLRVAAAAGTGKTATLAHRIVHLVTTESIEPEEVLGITFTNKAAEELADRFRQALSEHGIRGRQVEVDTYHGFAHRLLQEFGAVLRIERRSDVITPAYSRQLLRDALGRGDWQLIDLTRSAAATHDLARLSAQLGQNLLAPEDLLEAAPDDPDELWRHRLELAEALILYEREKRRLGSVDFADLIRSAHRLVTEWPELGGRIRDRYRAVLLDEYQDTDPAQRELLIGLFGDGFPVTAVGDPAQTIYEWRGASLRNFAGFPDHFADGEGPARTLELSVNRRSGRRVLELGNLVLDEIAPDGVRLRAAEGAREGRVATRWCRTSLDEARWLAAQAERLHEEGVRWSEMAVLFRKSKDIPLVRDALEEEGIPVEVASLGGLLSVPEVADLHAWLRLIGDPEDAPALARILLGSRFRLGMGDLVPLRQWVRQHSPRDPDEDEEGLPAHTFLEAIEHLDELEVEVEAGSRLLAFRALYRELLEVAQGVSLVELCRTILDRVGAWAEVEAMPEPSRISARLNLYRFLDLAEDWSPLEGRPSLTAFLDHLALLAEDEGEELDTARLSGEEAVALLTVHRAKGLEWDVVFLPALYDKNFPSDVREYPDPVIRPYVLPVELWLDPLPGLASEDHDERKQVLREQHVAQEWRIAYVAVTRAKHHLFLSGAYWYTPGTCRKPSALMELAGRLEGVGELGQETEPGEPPSTFRLVLSSRGAPDPVFPEGWEAALRAVVDDPAWAERRASELDLSEPFRRRREALTQMILDLPDLPEPLPEEQVPAVSVTGLVTYAGCPKRFYWSEVDRLPRRHSPAARRGVEIHRRIELHNRGAVPLEEANEDLYDLDPVEDRGAGGDPFGAFRRSRFAETTPLLVETPFDLAIGQGRVRGRIDAVYPLPPDAWEVVDFKSGVPTESPAARVQLEAYAVAITEVGLPDVPDRLRVTFAYLGDGLTEVSDEVDRQWLDEARRHLEELMEAIAGERFQPTPSPACQRCDFLRFCPAGRDYLASAPPSA